MTEEDLKVEFADTMAGVPDAFQRLWTPHRIAYIRREDPGDTSAPKCPFCHAPHRSDPDGLIVHRGVSAYVVMNLFPYAAGHMLVCPYRHVADYTDLTTEELLEVAELTRTAMRVLRQIANPPGFNLGINQGRVAGAGVAGHLHQHIVPRWPGDMNFMPIIGQTRSVPQLIEDERQMLVAAWPS